MSRLQAGGLALIIHSRFTENIGRVVKLVKNMGVHDVGYGELDCWCIECEKITTGLGKRNNSLHPSKYLMPLGDKQTQDELAKEKELEYLK